MRFEHRDGKRAPRAISLGPVRDKATVEDGVFVVDDDRDDFDAVADRLEAAGHKPLGEESSSDPVEEADDGQEEDVPLASEFDEQQLVDDLDYREKQAIASQYDHISGNAGEEKHTEELIKQRREEVED